LIRPTLRARIAAVRQLAAIALPRLIVAIARILLTTLAAAALLALAWLLTLSLLPTGLRRLLFGGRLATRLLAAGLFTGFAARLLALLSRLATFVAGLLLGGIATLTRTLPLAFTAALPLSATFLLGLRLLAALILAGLSRLISFRSRLTVGRWFILIPLISGLALIALAAAALTGLIAVLRISLLILTRLGDLALQLVRERIQFRLRQFELLRVISEDAFGRAFHAAPQLVNLAARTLTCLAGLRQVAFSQHLARKVQHLATLFALG
jgi:hypothetical protein